MRSRYLLLTLGFAIIIPNNPYAYEFPRDGYYWRDFAGEVPSDAFIGGRDSAGDPIYVGQTIHRDHIVNGQIYTDDNRLHYNIDMKGITTTNCIKILCTKEPDKLVWIETQRDLVHLLKDEHHLIVAGYFDEMDVDNFVRYIGRVFYRLETTVARIRCYKNQHSELCYSKEHGSTTACLFDTFDVLTYISPSEHNMTLSQSVTEHYVNKTDQELNYTISDEQDFLVKDLLNHEAIIIN